MIILLRDVTNWYLSGKTIIYKEEIVELALENAPDALISMFEGNISWKNFSFNLIE